MPLVSLRANCNQPVEVIVWLELRVQIQRFANRANTMHRRDIAPSNFHVLYFSFSHPLILRAGRTAPPLNESNPNLPAASTLDALCKISRSRLGRMLSKWLAS